MVPPPAQGGFRAFTAASFVTESLSADVERGVSVQEWLGERLWIGVLHLRPQRQTGTRTPCSISAVDCLVVTGQPAATSLRSRWSNVRPPKPTG